MKVIVLSILLFADVAGSLARPVAATNLSAHRSCSARTCIIVDTVRSRTWSALLSVRGYRSVDVAWSISCSRKNRYNGLNIVVAPLDLGRGLFFESVPVKDQVLWSSRALTARGQKRIGLEGKPKIQVIITPSGLNAEWKMQPTCRVHVAITAFRQ